MPIAVIHLTARDDGRGRLVELARRVGGDERHCVVGSFGQVYIITFAKPGVVRACHKHEATDEWFSVTSGAARFVFEQDGTRMEVEARAGEPCLIAVPQGVYHGIVSIEPQTAIVCIASQPYDKDVPDVVPARDGFMDDVVGVPDG